jgi:hypothetical protein
LFSSFRCYVLFVSFRVLLYVAVLHLCICSGLMTLICALKAAYKKIDIELLSVGTSGSGGSINGLKRTLAPTSIYVN